MRLMALDTSAQCWSTTFSSPFSACTCNNGSDSLRQASRPPAPAACATIAAPRPKFARWSALERGVESFRMLCPSGPPRREPPHALPLRARSSCLPCSSSTAASRCRARCRPRRRARLCALRVLQLVAAGASVSRLCARRRRSRRSSSRRSSAACDCLPARCLRRRERRCRPTSGCLALGSARRRRRSANAAPKSSSSAPSSSLTCTWCALAPHVQKRRAARPACCYSTSRAE